MGYRCAESGKHYDGKPVQIVTKTRTKVYPPKYDRDGNEICPGGRGIEIAKMELFSPDSERAKQEAAARAVSNAVRT